MSDERELLERTIAAIPPLDEAAARAAQARSDGKTKPQGALGRLEELATRLAAMRGTELPSVAKKAVVVMAADHGVTAEGVSAYPAEVTRQMVLNFVRGGAAINVLARAAGAQVLVCDLGVRGGGEIDNSVIDLRLGDGTANLARTPAMSADQARAAVESGIALGLSLADGGIDLLGTGDMGIGNTTSASAMVAAFCGAPAQSVTGRGTGIDDAAWRTKIAVITRALELHRPDRARPLEVLRTVGGFEIGGLAGLCLGAAARRVPVLIDGHISTAAALLAVELAPPVRGFLIAAHRSSEPGHRVALERLGLRPLLDLDMRLGEGTGAALAMPLVDAALRIQQEMASFESAGVSQKS